MIGLFIDTSSSNVSISIVRDSKIVSIIQEDTPSEHSKYATYYVKKVIDQAGIDANDVEQIFVVNGPGSFTGVRIGVAIAKTYGYLIHKDIIPVSSLKALAISSHQTGILMSVIMANRSNYYVGIYDGDYNEVIEEEFADGNRLLELIDTYKPYIVSNASNVIGKNKVHPSSLDVEAVVNYYKDKETVNYHALVPNYKKLPQAMENR